MNSMILATTQSSSLMKEGEALVNISPKDVELVARLARLELTEEETESFTGHLNDILRYVQKMNELDTEGVPPTSHVLPLVNVMRDDEIEASLPIDKVTKNAADHEDGQFRVPPVLD